MTLKSPPNAAGNTSSTGPLTVSTLSDAFGAERGVEARARRETVSICARVYEPPVTVQLAVHRRRLELAGGVADA